MKFNEKLILLRKQYNYTQEKLSEEIGVSRQAISRWESGDSTPEMVYLIALCKVFNVMADYLINDDIEKEEEVPIIRKKDEEIKAALGKRNMYFLISGICFLFGAFCSIIGVVTAEGSTQLTISIFSETVLLLMAVVQFYNFIRSRVKK